MSYLDAIRQADNEEQTADSRLQLLAGEETEEEVTQKDTERPQAARIYDAVTAGKESPSACIREVPKVPYGNLAQDGVINYNGICFVCDERTNSICLGNMEEKDKVINITLSGGGHLRVNRDNISDLAKAAGMFSPEDLNIIKNGPAERRRFMDAEICQLDKIYLSDLTKYNKVLNQRNKLLKDMYFHPELEATLSVWDMQLISYGRRIIKRRKQFIEQLNEIVYEIHKNLSGGKEELLLKYEPNIDDSFFEDELNRAKPRDIKYAQTSVGPHRDDISFSIADVDIRRFGSQGQQRTSALSLKLSEIKLVKQSIHDTPVLLLDDVLSELDSNRQNYLLENIKGIQTIITCTGLEEFVKNGININQTFEIVQGKINGN